MPEIVKAIAETAALTLEFIGIAVVTGCAIYVVYLAARRQITRPGGEDIYQRVRNTLGRGILLGLEFLVAADIINTVAVELTTESVLTLALIVLIRTFLSFAIEVEITGRWPWRGEARTPDG
jgi:uncharacterized membrane protein